MLRPAFSYIDTFLWFMVCIAGLSVRDDNLSVTSIVRALSLNESRYYNLLRCCHSAAIKRPILSQVWVISVLALFGEHIERVDGRIILLADGKKHAKAGKKMPGVKYLHQHSESNTKPSYVMAHSAQCVSVLAIAANTLFSVPLDMKIHEGLIFSNRETRTLLEKLLIMIDELALTEPFYLVADAYYGSGGLIKSLLKQDNHLITRAKNSFAYHHAPKHRGMPRHGRPAFYGRKVLLVDLFRSALAVTTIDSPVYGEKGIKLRIRTCDLLWKPAGRLVRFALVDHPTRSRMILMCSDLSLEPSQIIWLYGLSFKIELRFNQAVHVIDAYDYH